ncbi:hypothetical protein HED49_13915 [Ochrobactrum daejeonense]|nr:hypothetical protein [Brucella daejeonensis]
MEKYSWTGVAGAGCIFPPDRRLYAGILEVGPELTDEEADYAKNALIFLLSSAVNGTEVSDISDTVIHSNGIKSSIVSFIEKIYKIEN